MTEETALREALLEATARANREEHRANRAEAALFDVSVRLRVLADNYPPDGGQAPQSGVAV